MVELRCTDQASEFVRVGCEEDTTGVWRHGLIATNTPPWNPCAGDVDELYEVNA